MNGEIDDLKNLCLLKSNEVSEANQKFEKLEQVFLEFKYNADKIKDY